MRELLPEDNWLIVLAPASHLLTRKHLGAKTILP